MNNSYLVVLACYINSQVKCDMLIETLKKLKQENIDVCIVLHSNLYLTELSKYVKYLYYDYDNEYITSNDFYENIHHLNDSNCSLGSNIFWTGYDNGFTFDYTLPQYSKSALTLLRNSVLIANANKYEWTIYLEYDIPTPTFGYKKLISDKINLLIENGKNYFQYVRETNLVWPGIIIYKTEKLWNSTFMNGNWHLSKTDWIKHWGNTAFEYCVKFISENIYKNDSIEHKIQEHCAEIWSTNDYVGLSRSYEHTDKSNVIIHIYPEKIDNNYYLYLIAYNPNNVVNRLHNMEILYDDDIMYKNDCLELSGNSWFKIPISSIDGYETISLKYDKEIDKDVKSIVEKFNSVDVEKIHKYLCKFVKFENYTE